MTITVEIAVTSFHPGGLGGGIIIGWDRRRRQHRVQLGWQEQTRAPAAGETWRVTGELVVDPVYGDQIKATTALPLMPTGDGIRHWLATNPDIAGVGPKTADKLWDTFGEGLYDRLRTKDVAALATVVGPLAAYRMTEAYVRLADEAHALEWFDRLGIAPSVAILACRLWGGDAVERVSDDPYALCAAEPWKRVDERALGTGIALDDERRLSAAVREVVAARFSTRHRGTGGQLAASRTQLIRSVRRLLACDHSLAVRAFDISAARGDVREHGVDLWQARGPHLMERTIEKAISDRLNLGARPLPDGLMSAVLDNLAAADAIILDEAQRSAVETALTRRFAVVSGGAGTGKSTITKAIMAAVQRAGRPYLQMALSGRAAKRLVEANGHAAMTVHRFLKAARYENLRIRDGLVVVDEASMIGTPDLWQILTWLPADVDVVLVGDPAQLPPISAGNPLPRIMASGAVATASLQVIRRQGPGSEIPRVAAAIRSGEVPELPAFNPVSAPATGVSLFACASASVLEATLTVFEALAGPPPAAPEAVADLHAAGVQVLGATLKGPHGVEETAAAIERRWMAGCPRVHNWGVSIGSRILWTKNSYERPTGRIGADGAEATIDIMNGSIGVIERATAKGAVAVFDDAEATRAEIAETDLFNFTRGWAFTVHKAQGSAFEHVVVPLTKSRLLDRLLLYTAVTRARRSVVLVGDPELLNWALERPPAVLERRQTLLSASS